MEPCATCDAEVVASRDLLLIAGMRPVQRDRLRAAGIMTIDDLVGGVRDYGRVDLRLLNGKPMVLDINGNCDISNEGGFYNAAHAAGISHGRMLEQILLFAAARMPAAHKRLTEVAR